MIQGPLLLLIFFLAIAFIILMTAKVKMNAFLVLLFASFGVGILSGMEPVSVIKTITGGFGGILGYIGIVIIAGTIIGTMLEKSRATLTMANTVLALIGKSKSALAMSITGAGAMIMSHANDSYFWVVSQFSGLDTTTAYKTYSMATLIQGLTTMIFIFLLSLVVV